MCQRDNGTYNASSNHCPRVKLPATMLSSPTASPANTRIQDERSIARRAKELNARIVAGAGISPDDLMIQLSEGPGENFYFGRGLAQRAFISQGA